MIQHKAQEQSLHQNQTELIHTNPIYRRLHHAKRGNRTKKRQMSQHQINTKHHLPNTILEPKNELLHPNQSHLIPSSSIAWSSRKSEVELKGMSRTIIYDQLKEQMDRMSRQSARKQQQITEMNVRYSRLQQKYIEILEKSRINLEKQLQKSRNSSKIEIQSRQESKGNTSLIELRDRLNRVDFSGIQKLAKIQLKSQRKRNDKENHLPIFKQLKKRI